MKIKMWCNKSTTAVLAMTTSLTIILTVLTHGAQEEGIKPSIDRILVMTIAPDPTNEGFKRFNRSIKANRLELTVLGAKAVDEQSINSPSQQSISPALDRIDLYRKAVSSYKNDPHLLIMMVDSNELIVNGNKEEIISRFNNKFKKKTRILYSADSRCWPNPTLESQYPQGPVGGGERFLNSRAILGFAPALWDLFNLPIQESKIKDLQWSKKAPNRNEMDGSLSSMQLYHTLAYLNSESRQKLAIELDHKSELFQNLDSSESEVELEFDLDSVKLKNLVYHSEPLVVLGDESSRVVLNSLGNYLAGAWTVRSGCHYCNESMISLASTKESDLPSVLLGLFIEEPTPFLDEFFNSVTELNYPTDKLHLFIHNSVGYHDAQLEKFLSSFGSQYASKQVVKSYEQFMSDWQARDLALSKCKQLKCDYYFALDSVARIELPETLRILIEANRAVVAPLLSRPNKLWSNFWGSISSDGYYARSHDYVSLVKKERTGLWDVPLVMNAYLIDGKFIHDNYEKSVTTTTSKLANGGKTSNETVNSNSNLLTYHDVTLDHLKASLTFSHHLRSAGISQFMLNTHEFGHLVDPSTYNTSVLHPDFYQLKENMLEWEQHYLHENYSNQLLDSTKLEQPCQDVFWFPVVNELFCTQMIEIMEHFGRWSGGTNHDPRIEGGYESVPTRDIHLRQVGLHEMWLTFLREYIMPIQLKEYIGYEHDPPRAELAFVVRYHPGEQASLRAHHDSSTYTLNVALNEPHKDYEGGGCRFVRYNCSVVDSRKGWALIHPGRLTHYHEGLPVTNGTRYIMVTFVDP